MVSRVSFMRELSELKGHVGCIRFSVPFSDDLNHQLSFDLPSPVDRRTRARAVRGCCGTPGFH